MNLNQIYSFLAITKTLNFTSAARQLGIPQSTISRQINDLESRLQVRLFYRTRRDVHLTDEGRTFLPYAREIAEAAAKGTQAVQQLRDGNSGRLTISTVPAAESFLCCCLEKFHQKHPAIQVDLILSSAGETLVEDVNSICDFYFLYRDMLAVGEEFDTVRTHQESIGLVMSQSLWESLFAKAMDPEKRKRRTPSGGPSPSSEKTFSPSLTHIIDALPDAEFILLSEGSDPILYMQAMNYCRTHRFSPRVSNTFADLSALLLSLRCGMGISFLPASLAVQEDPLIFLPLDDDSYSIPCVAAWKKSLLNPAASLFLKTMPL